jgi:hypothetical protein
MGLRTVYGEGLWWLGSLELLLLVWMKWGRCASTGDMGGLSWSQVLGMDRNFWSGSCCLGVQGYFKDAYILYSTAGQDTRMS